MICANGSTIKGLDKKETKIKCDANSGTPRWVLFQTGGKLPKCLKACTSHDDCNMNNYINKEDGYVTISNTSLHEKSLKAYTIPPSTSNTNTYTQYDCKQTSHGGGVCFPSSCSKTSLNRLNARSVQFPQGGNHGDMIGSNLRLPLGHVGNLVCDPGYILNPSEMTGEVSNEINVVCMPDEVCGGTDWKLSDGSDVPECIEGIPWHNCCITFT